MSKLAGIVPTYLVVVSIFSTLVTTANAIPANNGRTVYYFDASNGDIDLGYDGKSPWGVSLDTLPVQNGYHLPAREGYIAYEDEYDDFADETEYGFGYYINSL